MAARILAALLLLAVIPSSQLFASDSAEEEWKDIRHTVSVSVSPYGYQYVDFYEGRDVIENAGIPLSEFGSSYGFGIGAAYSWRILPFLSVGAEAGFSGYYPMRTILPPSALYWQIPIAADLTFHIGNGRLSFDAGIFAGADISYLDEILGAYFTAGLNLGLSYRISESFSIFWKIQAGLSPQIKDDMQTSITYYIR